MRTMLLPLLLQAGASAMRAPMAGTLSRTAVSSITTVTNVHLPMRAPVVHQTRATSPVMFGPGGGGFLNLGAPEVIVIGAVAWALLGPKELYRLAREAGNFLGEWQQLGRQEWHVPWFSPRIMFMALLSCLHFRSHRLQDLNDGLALLSTKP
eukprot:6202402-Pleurochrysis_carterae.AAC.2